MNLAVSLLSLKPDAISDSDEAVVAVSNCIKLEASLILLQCLRYLYLAQQALHAQALQWAFAAVPGHPVLREVCNHISRNVDTRFSEDANLSILERRWPAFYSH